MYYSPEGLVKLFFTLLIIAGFTYPGYLIVNSYYKRKGEDTSLPGNYEKTIWGGFLVSVFLFLIIGTIYRWISNP
jgi:hypothetical protein